MPSLLLALTVSLVAAPSRLADRVLVVANRRDPESLTLARQYRALRKVPPKNVLALTTGTGEEISRAAYESEIEAPVRRALSGKSIDFIVLMRGIPLRLSDSGLNGGYSVDAFLAAHPLNLSPIAKLEEGDIRRAVSPYFNAGVPFRRQRFGFYLVTRIDGYTFADASALIKRAGQGRPLPGPFVFDESPNRNDEGYRDMQQTLGRAAAVVRRLGREARHDSTAAFVVPGEPLAGYAGWGSNDSTFNLEAYRRLRFAPGALAETFVSTSGRTFRPTDGGQSLIADLIAQGITGVKGYVSEPNTFALARPEVLFDRYLRGFTLAESFYAASPILKWKDVVIGDPICAPYAR